MLFSIAVILALGMFMGYLCEKIGLPSLIGMIFAGILLGPKVSGLIDTSILFNSEEIRKMALIIILLRAGLKLSLSDFKKIGRPAILMCFLPASFEILGIILIAPYLLGISRIDATVLGAVIAAVSPAVIVPKMIKLMDEGYGVEKGIPQMILAGASVDDVFVIVVFTSAISLAKGESVSAVNLLNIPLSIALGILVGCMIALLLLFVLRQRKLDSTVYLIIWLVLALFLVTVEDKWGTILPFASLLAVMSLGAMFRHKREELAMQLSSHLDKLWVVAEVFLFVLLGASIAIDSMFDAGPNILVVLGISLVFRVCGVLLALIKTSFNIKEKLFSTLAYLPKATVQAAIGGVPLAMGLSSGEMILSVSVIAILLTAPVGAIAIDKTYRALLDKLQRK